MNDKKQIFAWAMYDWANSAYVTTVAVAVLPIFFADVVVGDNGTTFFGYNFRATTLWAWTICFSSIILFLTAPVLGAIADFKSSKRKFLFGFCMAGSLASVSLLLCGPGDVLLTMTLFTISQIGFIGGNVFYDAFLPQIASEDKIDWVSSKGFAYGYIGGGIHFFLSLILISQHDVFGLSLYSASKIAMASAGLWWGSFSLITFFNLKEKNYNYSLSKKYEKLNPFTAVVFTGFSRMIDTAGKIIKVKHLLIFLLAYMIYNDGIQTVISVSSIYGRQELKLSPNDLMLTLLMIQFIAFFGALLFGKLGTILSAKKALIISLVLWSFVVIYAYFMKTSTEYYILGVIVGLAMGGSQSLSRSLYGTMIPAEEAAEYYGFYSIFSKFSSIWGPLVFGSVDFISGSSRQAIISLIFFFIVGLFLLSFVNINKAAQAKNDLRIQ
jgi:MFS transporter, UMF1 family